jgi:hypothetical protein
MRPLSIDEAADQSRVSVKKHCAVRIGRAVGALRQNRCRASTLAAGHVAFQPGYSAQASRQDCLPCTRLFA